MFDFKAEVVGGTASTKDNAIGAQPTSGLFFFSLYTGRDPGRLVVPTMAPKASIDMLNITLLPPIELNKPVVAVGMDNMDGTAISDLFLLASA